MTTETPKTDPTPEAQPSELETLRAEAAKAAEYLDLAKRTQAEFINWQNRARREREDLAKYGIESFVREMLPALDDLSNTIKVGSTDATNKTLIEAVKLSEREFLRVLAKSGIKPIVIAEKFDPMFHDAVVMEPSDKPSGTILEEMRRGYTIHDRVLRPAQVRVACAPPPASPQA